MPAWIVCLSIITTSIPNYWARFPERAKRRLDSFGSWSSWVQIPPPRPFQISGDFRAGRGGEIRRRDDAPRFREDDAQDRDRPFRPP